MYRSVYAFTPVSTHVPLESAWSQPSSLSSEENWFQAFAFHKWVNLYRYCAQNAFTVTSSVRSAFIPMGEDGAIDRMVGRAVHTMHAAVTRSLKAPGFNP
jgi:hypothetical protein